MHLLNKPGLKLLNPTGLILNFLLESLIQFVEHERHSLLDGLSHLLVDQVVDIEEVLLDGHFSRVLRHGLLVTVMLARFILSSTGSTVQAISIIFFLRFPAMHILLFMVAELLLLIFATLLHIRIKNQLL